MCSEDGYRLISWLQAEEVLKSGGSIGYPTDTVWGIGCLADDPEYVTRCLLHKGENRTPICSVIVPDLSLLDEYVDFSSLPETAQFAVRACLPGRYTFILRLTNKKLLHVAGPGPSLGVRSIDLGELQPMVARLGRPLLTTSLNKTKEPTATTLEEAKAICRQMGIPCVDFTAEGGASAEAGQSSTSLRWDAEKQEFEVLRLGSGPITDEIRNAGVRGIPLEN